MRPTAAKGTFPYKHRTMEQVMAAEEAKRIYARDRYARLFKSERKAG